MTWWLTDPKKSSEICYFSEVLTNYFTIYETPLNLTECIRQTPLGKFINFYLKENHRAPWTLYPMLSIIHQSGTASYYKVLLILNAYLEFLKEVDNSLLPAVGTYNMRSWPINYGCTTKEAVGSVKLSEVLAFIATVVPRVNQQIQLEI